MKRYIRAGYTSYTSGPRSNRARKAKSSEKRRELYDRVYDIMEALGDVYSNDAIAMNVSARGSRGSRINAFRFESTTDTEGRYRFNEEEAKDVMESALDVINELGIADRCDVYIESEIINGKKGYNVNIDVALDPTIVD